MNHVDCKLHCIRKSRKRRWSQLHKIGRQRKLKIFKTGKLFRQHSTGINNLPTEAPKSEVGQSSIDKFYRRHVLPARGFQQQRLKRSFLILSAVRSERLQRPRSSTGTLYGFGVHNYYITYSWNCSSNFIAISYRQNCPRFEGDMKKVGVSIDNTLTDVFWGMILKN